MLSSWTRVIIDTLEAHGIDSRVVLQEAGFSPTAFVDPAARHPAHATRALWEAAARAVGDPACGLTIARHVQPTTFQALGYAVFASSSLRDALGRLVRYAHFVSEARQLVLEATEPSVRLVFRTRGGGEPLDTPEAIDAVMALIVRTCRMLTDRSFSLRLVEQRRPTPLDTLPYERVFRSPIRFGCQDDALTFASADLDRPLPHANPELALHNELLVREQVAKLDEGTLVDRVRAVLVEGLTGERSPAFVARALHMSERSLQRHLAQAGTSFAQVLGDTRRELACDHLRTRRWSVAEVAFLVGFDDASSFSRAFRRWTGLSPTEYRAQQWEPEA